MIVILRTSRVMTTRPVGLTTNYNGLLRSTGPDQAWRKCFLEFLYAGPVAWNNLPADIQAISDTSSFKQSVKTHYFRLAFNVYQLLIVLCLFVFVVFILVCRLFLW